VIVNNFVVINKNIKKKRNNYRFNIIKYNNDLFQNLLKIIYILKKKKK